METMEQVLKIATEAKDIAHEAKIVAFNNQAKVDSYIKVNTIQYEHLIKQMSSIQEGMKDGRDDIKTLYNRAWIVAGSIIALLCAGFGSIFIYVLQLIAKSNGIE